MNEAKIAVKNEIVLIRGISGSGKSTRAKEFAGYVHLEADMYLIKDGIYTYDHTKIRAAHDWCLNSAKQALEQGRNVVVSNTFVKIWELQRYIDLGFPYKIIQMTGEWQNIHNVPAANIQTMRNNWEDLPIKLAIAA
jgi:predicted kinase